MWGPNEILWQIEGPKGNLIKKNNCQQNWSDRPNTIGLAWTLKSGSDPSQRMKIKITF